MKCTSCSDGQLQPTLLEGSFRAHGCDHCDGIWILVEDFVSWKELNPEHHFGPEPEWTEEEISDSKRAMFCPVSGAIMRKFRISAGTQHKLDYSAAVGGIWLDKGEWQLLKQQGVADTLNMLVTQQWQTRIRHHSSRESFAAMYQTKFGEETYGKLKELRGWLKQQPNMAEIKNYLLAEDPYSAER